MISDINLMNLRL